MSEFLKKKINTMRIKYFDTDRYTWKVYYNWRLIGLQLVSHRTRDKAGA